MCLPGHTKDEWLRSWTYLCLNLSPLTCLKRPIVLVTTFPLKSRGQRRCITSLEYLYTQVHIIVLAKAMNSGSKINRIFNAANWEKNHYDIPFLCWLYEARFLAAPTSVFPSGSIPNPKGGSMSGFLHLEYGQACWSMKDSCCRVEREGELVAHVSSCSTRGTCSRLCKKKKKILYNLKQRTYC